MHRRSASESDVHWRKRADSLSESRTKAAAWARYTRTNHGENGSDGRRIHSKMFAAVGESRFKAEAVAAQDRKRRSSCSFLAKPVWDCESTLYDTQELLDVAKRWDVSSNFSILPASNCEKPNSSMEGGEVGVSKPLLTGDSCVKRGVGGLSPAFLTEISCIKNGAGDASNFLLAGDSCMKCEGWDGGMSGAFLTGTRKKSPGSFRWINWFKALSNTFKVEEKKKMKAEEEGKRRLQQHYYYYHFHYHHHHHLH